MNVGIDLDFFFDGTLGYNIKTTENYKKNLEKCQQASEALIAEIKNKSNEILNSFSFDYQNKIKTIREKIVKKKNTLVVGLGGSSAGAKALSMYLGNSIYFFDNYDLRYIDDFFKKHDLKEFQIYIISKSGNTFETLAMLNLIYQHLLSISNKELINNNLVIVTEVADNILNNFANQNGIQVVSHNKKIGGRYSVFSETGMILFDINPKEISDSANSVVSKLMENNVDDQLNPTVNAAIILSLQEHGIKFNVNLLYDYSLKNYSYWFHQLFAESLGKNENAMTPTTSICPKDHHSMAQLFIGGPKDKFFNIYPPAHSEHFKSFADLDMGIIQKKTPENLLQSQYLGLVKTFRNKKIPHRIIKFIDKFQSREANMLELFSYNILETIILGYAQNINPYDQPAVEDIKINTFNS